MTAARGGGILLVWLNLRFNQYSSDLQFCYHYFKLIYLVNFEGVFKYCKYIPMIDIIKKKKLKHYGSWYTSLYLIQSHTSVG